MAERVGFEPTILLTVYRRFPSLRREANAKLR